MPRILFIAILLMPSFPRLYAAECQCPPLTPKEQTEQATYIFNGEVWDVEVDRATQKKVITLDVNDTFKGTPASRLEVRDAEDGKPCAIDAREGESYLVYARWQWGATLTSRCWGTKRIQEAGVDAQTLGPGDAAKAKYYDKLQVHCMGRRDTPCCLSSVKAMRTGRYLPQPEAGCPDEMIPNRLRCEGSYVWCVPTVDPYRHTP
jgi:hypothetical protein